VVGAGPVPNHVARRVRARHRRVNGDGYDARPTASERGPHRVPAR
jgi:hypothetical protein